MVNDPNDFSGVNDLSVIFTPYGTSTYPGAAFDLSSLTTIASLISGGPPPTDGPFEGFQYNTPDLPGTIYAEDDGNTANGANYYGFFLQDGDGATYAYGVDGTTYSGDMVNVTVNDPAAAPEPASVALLAAGLLGTAAARRRTRRRS